MLYCGDLADVDSAADTKAVDATIPVPRTATSSKPRMRRILIGTPHGAINLDQSLELTSLCLGGRVNPLPRWRHFNRPRHLKDCQDKPAVRTSQGK